MGSVFLHGGGGRPEAAAATFGRIAAACGRGLLAVVVADADPAQDAETAEYYLEVFSDSGRDRAAMLPIFVSPEAPLKREVLERARPSLLFVCGGESPFYHAALCDDRSWVSYLNDSGAVYAGTSAGAAIAPETAIIGGWLSPDGSPRQILFQGAGEGLDRLAVAAGLGLAPFAVDVHASQWGTLSRLVHAVEGGLVTEGWAIDEDTMLEVTPEGVAVYGLGYAYRARRRGVEVAVAIHRGGDVVR